MSLQTVDVKNPLSRQQKERAKRKLSVQQSDPDSISSSPRIISALSPRVSPRIVSGRLPTKKKKKSSKSPHSPHMQKSSS